MLIGAKFEFKVVVDPSSHTEEGAQIAVTDDYRCCAIGNEYYVSFTSFTNDQILIIKPDSNNHDPDGGCDFMKNNVLKFIESLISNKQYI